MIDSSFRARASIDLRALKKNLSQISAHCPESQIVPVIKANAYGHGVEKVALALNAMHRKFAALAVASMEEAMELRSSGRGCPPLSEGAMELSCAQRALAFMNNGALLRG